MRPTRWTTKKRVTYFGQGGWKRVGPRWSYTNPVTGHGVNGPTLQETLKMRREQEKRYS